MARMRGAWRKGIFLQMVKRAANPVPKNPCAFGRLFCLSLTVLAVLALILLGRPALALSTEAPPPAPTPVVPSGPSDFDACVQLALRQSPFFTKSALEIEVRRFDEKDSKSDFFPSLTGSARYYLVQPNNNNNAQNYQWAISTGNYNPLFAYLSLKANRIITQIATLAHIKVISAGIERLGKAFLELNSVETLIQLRAKATELAKDNLRYAKERQRLGEITPLEVQIATQELELATAEQETLITSRSRLKEALRNFLGLKPDQDVSLEVNQARRQVLGDFDPKKASLQDAESRSIDVRIKQMTKELQTWHVTLAKMKFVPSVNMAMQSPDPLSNNNVRGTFFSVGVSFPIFDGFKRLRNIDRQKTVLGQFTSEEEVVEKELSQKWREAEEKLNTAAAALRTAQAQAELSRLKETQGETLYRAAEKDYSLLMTARQTRVKAQMDAVKKALDYDVAVLALRSLSMDLVYHYVSESQFQK
jgi:outer membrane protein TolC